MIALPMASAGRFSPLGPLGMVAVLAVQSGGPGQAGASRTIIIPPSALHNNRLDRVKLSGKLSKGGAR
jgi:hypothetical protein